MKRTEIQRQPFGKKRKKNRFGKDIKPADRTFCKHCDEQWKLIVRALANETCEQCGNPGADAHHMVGRTKSRFLHHSIQNGVYLCKPCHFRFHFKESNTLWKLFEQVRPDDYAFVTENMDTAPKDKYEDVLVRLKNAYEALEEK